MRNEFGLAIFVKRLAEGKEFYNQGDQVSSLNAVVFVNPQRLEGGIQTPIIKEIQLIVRIQRLTMSQDDLVKTALDYISALRALIIFFNLLLLLFRFLFFRN